MKRREFITLLGGAATWPLAAHAQQAGVPVVGFLRSTSSADSTSLVTAFRQGLKETGYIDGQNIALEFRWAENQPARLPRLIAELIERKAAVIVVNNPAVRAAKAATATIPIVFTTGSDPVRDGLVASLNQPGGNLTGVTFLSSALGSKRLELFRQIVPKTTTLAVLIYPNTAETEAERKDLQDAAQAIGQQIMVFDVSSDQDIDTAFATLVSRGAGALLLGSGPFFFSRRQQLVALAARNAIPAMYTLREMALAGGLMSYGTSISEAHRQAGIYAGRILKGEKPADLPVMQSTKFEFIINLKTAKALGLEVPAKLLALADEVIE